MAAVVRPAAGFSKRLARQRRSRRARARQRVAALLVTRRPGPHNGAMPEIANEIVPPLRARVGVVLPSANPVVEEEMRALLPPTIRLHATRLPAISGDLQVRTDRYVDHYPDMVRSFGDLALDA